MSQSEALFARNSTVIYIVGCALQEFPRPNRYGKKCLFFVLKFSTTIQNVYMYMLKYTFIQDFRKVKVRVRSLKIHCFHINHRGMNEGDIVVSTHSRIRFKIDIFISGRKVRHVHGIIYNC